ncbi:hypothetical protein V2J09_017443 [Rumex salicifolius]
MPKCGSCGVVGSVPQLLVNLQVIQFMVGLNDVYASVRTNILMMKPVPSLGEVYHMLLQDENHRELRSDAPLGVDSSAMAASSNGGGGRGQSNFNTRGGGRGGRGSSRGGRSGSDRKSLYFCDHCKTQGHTIDRCFKLHGYPPQRNDKPQGSGSFSGCVDVPSSSNSGSFQHSGPSSPDSVPNLTRDQYNQLLALLGKLDSTDTAPKSSMMADSGATHHITPYSSLMDLSLSTSQVLGKSEKGLVFISRDVIFKEETFPFADQSSTQPCVPLPPILTEFPVSPPATSVASPPVSVEEAPVPVEEVPVPVPLPVSRSGRITRPPTYLRDYV